MYQFFYATNLSANHVVNLLMLGDPDRVRSQITSVVLQIRWFDFDCTSVLNLDLV